MFEGKALVSTDGVHYVSPGALPETRSIFPPDLWGDPKTSTNAAFPKGTGVSVISPVDQEARAAQPAHPRVGATQRKTATLGLPSSGELKQHSMLHIFAACASRDATVLTTVALETRTLWIAFRGGEVLAVESSDPADSLEAFLVARGLLTPQQLTQAEAQRQKLGGELLSALIQLGFLPLASIHRFLVERALKLLEAAFSSDSGKFAFSREIPPPSLEVSLGKRWGLYADLCRRAPIALVHRALEPLRALGATRRQPIVPLEALGLRPQELRALHQLDGTLPLSSLGEQAEGEIFKRTVWMLAPLEAIAFSPVVVARAAPSDAPYAPDAAQSASPSGKAPSENPPSAKGRTYAAGPSRGEASPMVPPERLPNVEAMARDIETKLGPPPSSKDAQAASPRPQNPSPVPAADDVASLTALLQEYKGKSHFELLGVAKDAPDSAIKASYLKLARRFHPDTAPPNSSQAFIKARSDLLALIGDAYRTLSNSASRATYTSEFESGASGAKVDVAVLLRAEEQFKKGCILIKVRKWQEALGMFQEACTASPDQGEYFGWLSYAKWMSSSDPQSGASQAVRDFTRAIALAPAVAQLHYFLGSAQKNLGDRRSALEAFEKCLALDPRHIDAQRELRGSSTFGQKTR